VYQHSPVFQDLITDSLLGVAFHSRDRRAWKALLASLETLIFPLVLLAGAVIGAGFMLLTAALLPLLVSLPLAWIGQESLAIEVRRVGTWTFVCLILFSLLVTGLAQASKLHRRMLVNAGSTGGGSGVAG
jgi:hypothetical protein